MGDAENTLPPSKKRAAGRELSRDNPGLDDEEESNEQETGSFQKASEEVLAGRRIVKVRRNPASSAPSLNPFAAIRLVPPPTASPVVTTENHGTVTGEAARASEETVSKDVEIDATKETDGAAGKEKVEKEATGKAAELETAKENIENKAGKEAEKNGDEDGRQAGETISEPTADAGKDTKCSEVKDNNEAVKENDQATSDDKKESGADKTEGDDKKDDGSVNAEKNAEGASLSSFQQLSSSQNAFTGLAGTGFSSTSFSFGSSPPELSASGATSGSFSFGFSNNGNSSLFNASKTSIASKTEGSSLPTMQEVQVETGEENERVAFSADSVLFEFFDGGWKERGKGEVKVNVSTTEIKKARLLMRAKGNYRLILNASIYPEMKLTNMEKRGITFACVNSISDAKDGLCTFALKFKDGSVVDEFREAVMAHKGNTNTVATALKTPENSPKAAEH